MEVQSLSIVVPAKCPNRCPFCVSYMNKENKKFETKEFDVSLNLEICKRMKFTRDNGTNTLMLTSTGEALENMEYIVEVLKTNSDLPNPFDWIELQTSGVGLEDAINEYPSVFNKISTISLSVIDIFDSEDNANEMIIPKNRRFDLDNLVKFLKDMDFNVRLSINLTDLYNNFEPIWIFGRLVKLDVDQVTFRKLYTSGNGTKQDRWINNNSIDDKIFDLIIKYIEHNGNPLERLPFGAMKYSLNGISTVVDSDCMNKEVKNVMKYLILRPNGKLYSRWDDKGSLIF